MLDVALTYWLLINANISDEKRRLARATMGKLTYVDMKKQLRAIHDYGSNYYFSEQDGKINH